MSGLPKKMAFSCEEINQSTESKPLSTVDANLVQAFIRTWAYDQKYGGKCYLQIARHNSNRSKLSTGFESEGKIVWAHSYIMDTDGIYLILSGEALKGAFVSSNFYATHGDEFTYRVALEMKPTNHLRYSVWSSIRGETDEADAIRVTWLSEGATSRFRRAWPRRLVM